MNNKILTSKSGMYLKAAAAIYLKTVTKRISCKHQAQTLSNTEFQILANFFTLSLKKAH